MGLDFSHCNAHWSYMGFMRFRTRLAAEIGIDLESMIGFGGDILWSTVHDPIKPFLDHSDCDGHLTPSQCRKIAPRLRELVANWDDDWDKQQALELAAGMDEAALSKEALIFC